MSAKIAICVGHSRKINGRVEGGAVSRANVSEWDYNRDLARMIEGILHEHRIASFVIDSYEGGGYGSAQRWLARQLSERGATLAVELHFNDSDSDSSNGHEWLYWSTSERAKKLASSINAEMCLIVPRIKSRGVKPKTSADRGAEFLRGTHCPAVICEPFFGRNPSDWQIATAEKRGIARAIALGIIDFAE